jgi:SPP1 family phage portal protein
LNKETVIDKDWIFVDRNQYYKKKRPYVLTIGNTKIDGDEIIAGENYPDFPIVPLWANTEHQSELVGMREQLDAYDLIKNATANDVDASIIYWTLTNAGGMDEMDLAKFIERLKRLHATILDDDVQAEAHTVDIPVQSRESILDRIERDLYRDAMALNTENIANGAVTATQIQASYEPLNAKADMYEYCLIDFINKILALAGIDDEPTFTRSKIVNTTEEIQVLNVSAPNLTQEYVTRKTLELMGDGDKADEIVSGVLADNIPTVE